MENDRFADNFEQITQTYFFVGVTRFKDIRKFNYKATANGDGMVGITNHIDYIDIQTSVDLSFRVGKIGINDNVDLRKNIQLMGNEILYIEYNNTNAAQASTSLTKKGFFRVLSIEENSDSQQSNPSLRHTNRYLLLTIAEFPYVDLLTINRLNKTYHWDGGTTESAPKGPKSISDIVADMFTDPLSREVTTNMGISVYSEPTDDKDPIDMMNYYSPYWSKLKNINFLKRFAVSFNTGGNYYYLNCEEDSIKFKSIYSEFLSIKKETNKIEFMPSEFYNMIPSYDVSPADIANVLMDVTFRTGNVLDALFSGLAGHTHCAFDFLSGHIFGASDYRNFKNVTKGNDQFYINFENFGNQQSNMNYSPFTNPKLIKNLDNYEYAKKSFNSMTCEATTFISSGRYIGQCANVIIPNASSLTKDIINPTLGSNWCIWGYRDIIVNQRGICKLTLKKDSTDMANFGVFGSMKPGQT